MTIKKNTCNSAISKNKDFQRSCLVLFFLRHAWMKLITKSMEYKPLFKKIVYHDSKLFLLDQISQAYVFIDATLFNHANTRKGKWSRWNCLTAELRRAEIIQTFIWNFIYHRRRIHWPSNFVSSLLQAAHVKSNLGHAPGDFRYPTSGIMFYTGNT